MKKALILILWFLLIAQQSFGAATRIACFSAISRNWMEQSRWTCS